MRVNNSLAHTFRRGILFLLIVMLSACQSVPNADVKSNSARQLPSKYKCENGQKFTITFSKDLSSARLLLSGTKKPEILENKNIAGGISYGNDKYLFEEHGEKQGVDEKDVQGRETILGYLNEDRSKDVITICKNM